MGGGKTILLTAWGGAADVFPVLGLGRELARRGHRAVLAAPAEHAAEAAALGLAFQPLRPALPEDAAARARLARRLADPRRGRRQLWRDLVLPGLRDSLADLCAAPAADLVVAHADVPAAAVYAQARGLPWLPLVLRPAGLASRHDPPALPGLGLLRLLPPGPAGWLLRRALAGPETARPLAALRGELGLPAAAPCGGMPPHGVLALLPAAFRPPCPDHPPDTLMAGFVGYDGAACRPVPGELADFLDAGAPPVVFTLGAETVRLAGDFFATAMAAAARLGRRAVMLVGRGAVLGAPPSAGVAVVDYAPLSLLLPRAAAVVHHGGIGTTAQALRAARPTLIVPFGGDQHENARLAAGLGAAAVLPRARLRPATLERALARLLADETVPRRAARAAAALGRDGAACAADAVEAVLRGRPATAALLRPRLVHSA